MEFTHEFINGEKPIYPYLARKIEQYAKEKYGLDMIVTVEEDEVEKATRIG